eukprot:tig00000743_g3864.t1
MCVVGSRGLGPVKRLLLGSVSDYLAHHLPMPVLVFRAPSGYNREDVGEAEAAAASAQAAAERAATPQGQAHRAERFMEEARMISIMKFQPLISRSSDAGQGRRARSGGRRGAEDGGGLN